MDAPDEVETLNFSAHGIRWTVRNPTGDRLRFFTLAALREAIEEGRVDARKDTLSFNDESFRPLAGIPDLRAYFWSVFTRHRAHQLDTGLPIIDQGHELIDDDAPTTIAMPDTMLSRQIREALARELAARVEEKSLPPAPPPPQPAPAQGTVLEYALTGFASSVLAVGIWMWLVG